MKKKILIVLLVLFIGIQFIRAEENNGPADTAQDISHFVQVPGPVMNVLKTSCYDCHSNHTRYPWYAKVNPVGMWLNHHIEEGKEEINFSDFSKYDVKRLDHKLEEIAEEAQEGHMPLPIYTFLNTDAKLTEAQIRLLVDWVKTERQKLDVPGKESK